MTDPALMGPAELRPECDELSGALHCAAVDRAVKAAAKAAATPFDWNSLIPASVREAA